MDKLKKYDLDSSLSYEYLCDNLKDVNELSTKITELVNFQEGNFFTFLCDDINIQQLYQFKYGGVAKNVKTKTLDLIFKLIKSFSEISVIFDDFNSEFSENSTQSLFLDYGFYYKNQIYYSMERETVSKKKLQECFYVSDILWHSLCVLSKIKLDRENRELSDEQIKQICINAQLILVEAYDGEGYVFWKRNDFVIGELLEADFVSQED